MTTTASATNAEEAIDFLHERLAAGEHWYVALLKSMARWDQAEETIGDRRYRYLIGGEAFDWLLLAERLLDELHSDVAPRPEREALLFHGHPPLEIDEDEFQVLIGTPKYQAYLNFLYGVTVEEALQVAVEEEIGKERHGYVWSRGYAVADSAYHRIYGQSQDELLAEFAKERHFEAIESMDVGELKEFTYWLFKYRVKTLDGARVASDTRKGLVMLSRIEVAFRTRLGPKRLEPEGAAEAS